jgi:hypothetical protein
MSSPTPAPTPPADPKPMPADPRPDGGKPMPADDPKG